MEHKSHQPKCAFLKIKDPYAVTVGDVLDLEKAAISNFLVSHIEQQYQFFVSHIEVILQWDLLQEEIIVSSL